MLGKFVSLSSKTKKIILIFLGLIILATASYFAWLYFGFSLPESFKESRQAASLQAQAISSVLKETPNVIQKVYQLQLEKKDDQALILLVEEIKKNQMLNEALVKLSLELEKMAKSIPEISSKKAAQKALVAVSVETQLMYKLISFNEHLSQLLRLLQDKITNKIYGVEKINQVIDLLNQDIDAINNLNNQFNAYLSEFDGFSN